eukprot:53629_1
MNPRGVKKSFANRSIVELVISNNSSFSSVTMAAAFLWVVSVFFVFGIIFASSIITMAYLIPSNQQNNCGSFYHIICCSVRTFYDHVHEKVTRQKEISRLNKQITRLRKLIMNQSLMNDNNSKQIKYKQLNIKYKQLNIKNKQLQKQSNAIQLNLNAQIRKLQKQNDEIQRCYKAQIEYYTNNTNNRK